MRYTEDQTANLSGGTSLVVQWLRLHTPSTGGPGSIPGQGDPASFYQDPVQPNKYIYFFKKSVWSKGVIKRSMVSYKAFKT